MMAIKIVGTPKEIAVLVLELQGRQEESSMEAIERIIAVMPKAEIGTGHGFTDEVLLHSSSDCKRPFSERMARRDG